MNTGPVLVFPPSIDAQVEPGQVRPASPSPPGSGGESIREIGTSQNSTPAPAGTQDEVKVQLEPPDEIPVYQFVNQQGTVVLQVPPQPLLNLALDISQELAAESASQESAGVDGGKNNGR
jgi:hypothetical protein